MPANPDQHSRILIVEDELLVAADLETTLKDLGYCVVGTAQTGPAALQMVEESRPDLVLMDIHLRGGIDGIEAADSIRRKWQLPVIFLTSYSNVRMRARAQAAAAYGYLLKPFRPRELNSAMLLAIAQHRSARTLFTKDNWLRTVLDTLSDAVIATDLEGRVRYINPSAERLTGWDAEKAIGIEIEQLYRLRTLLDQPVEIYPVRKALESRSAIASLKFILRSESGQAVVVEDSASPIVVENESVGAVAILRDVTEHMQRERRQEAEHERLEVAMARANEALGETRAELRALSSHLILGQEEERRRLSRELHDDLGQRAAVIGMRVSRALEQLRHGPEQTRELLQSISDDISALNQGLREASHRLHPAVLEDLGLVAALRSLLLTFREEGREISFKLPNALPSLDQDAATALYRIAQEALRNAIKHAPDAPIHLTLGVENNKLELVIRDAGPGFDLSTVRLGGGLGLLSMQERARLANGTLSLDSSPGEGTVVRVLLPVEMTEVN